MNIIPSTEINSEKMANRTNLMVQTDTDNNTHLHLLIARQKKLKLQCSNLWCNHMRYSKIAQGTDLKSTTLYYRERGRGGGDCIYKFMYRSSWDLSLYIKQKSNSDGENACVHLVFIPNLSISQLHSCLNIILNEYQWVNINWMGLD